jgi:hypothetical protein
MARTRDRSGWGWPTHPNVPNFAPNVASLSRLGLVKSRAYLTLRESAASPRMHAGVLDLTEDHPAWPARLLDLCLQGSWSTREYRYIHR